ncbi:MULTISPECIES: SURF1 family protein [unclassified Polynucleobacter]|jgi:cytochrome oxidase assembly protein ShyY1|uniref:SURF1 family protein n=1 Tax=unclassified Polynucleobacter TaxID=2640945 RepID=UPI0025EC001E|nr:MULTISPECIES: SURF1 family protein [unclassified Polynucleobacter]
MFSSLITSRIVATLSALLVILVGCGAGIWQLNRAEQKIRLGESLSAKLQMPILNANTDNLTLERAAERRILVRGSFMQDEVIWLDNRPRPIPEGGAGASGQSGFYVMMPMKLDGQEAVLWVNRGWAPRNNENRIELPPVQTTDEVVTIEGIAFPHPGRVYELGQKADTKVRPRIEQNFDLGLEAQSHAWKQLPFIIRESESDKKDGLVRNWPSPTNGVDRHYAYAFQWFVLALAGFLFWLINGLIKYQRELAVNGDRV